MGSKRSVSGYLEVLFGGVQKCRKYGHIHIYTYISIYTWISCVYPNPHKNLGFPDSLSFYEGFYIHMDFMCISIYTYTHMYPYVPIYTHIYPYIPIYIYIYPYIPIYTHMPRYTNIYPILCYFTIVPSSPHKSCGTWPRCIPTASRPIPVSRHAKRVGQTETLLYRGMHTPI